MDKYAHYQIEHNPQDASVSYLKENDKIIYVKKVVTLENIFLNEVRILGLFKAHRIDRVPKLVEYFTEGHIIIYEYIPGIDLYRYTEDENITIQDRMCIGFQLIEILYNLHRLGVFHRDIKLENFVVSDDCKLYLIDFGLACLISDDYEFTEMVPGSTAYVSKEYVRLYLGMKAGISYYKNKINTVLRSNDIFALSITMYALFNIDFPYIDEVRFNSNYDELIKTLSNKKYKETFYVTEGPANSIIVDVINLCREPDYRKRILLWNALTINLK